MSDDEADAFMHEWGEWAKWSDARSMVQAANYRGYVQGKEDGRKAATASHAAEVEALRADAERYRWLRKSRDVTLITMFFGNGCVNKTIEMADEKIDAALKGDKP